MPTSPPPHSERDPERLVSLEGDPRAEPCARCGWSILSGETLCQNCGLAAPEQLAQGNVLRVPGALWQRTPLASLLATPAPSLSVLRERLLSLRELPEPELGPVARALVATEPLRCLAPLAAARDARTSVLAAALALRAQGRLERIVVVVSGAARFPWRARWRSLLGQLPGKGELVLCEREALPELDALALCVLDDWDQRGPLDALALRRTRAVRHRVVLSAMPLVRGARELHALLEWLRPGAAGDVAQWSADAPPRDRVRALSLLAPLGPALFASEPSPAMARPEPMARTLAQWLARYGAPGEAQGEGASEAHALLGLHEWGPDGARWVLARVQGSEKRALGPRELVARRAEFVAASELLREYLRAGWWPGRG